MEEAVETIAVRQVDLRRANGCDTVVMLITDHISKHPRNLRKTGGKHGQHYEPRAQPGAHHSSDDDERNRKDEKIRQQVRASHPD